MIRKPHGFRPKKEDTLDIDKIEGISPAAIVSASRNQQLVENGRLREYSVKLTLLAGLFGANVGAWICLLVNLANRATPSNALAGGIGMFFVGLVFGGMFSWVGLMTLLPETPGRITMRLRYGLCDEARSFLKAHKDEMKVLRNQVWSFNLGLAARKKADGAYRRELEPELYDADVANWESRRDALWRDILDLNGGFATATASALKRIEADASRKEAIAAFRKEAEDLRQIESSLELGSGRLIGDSVTRDLSSLVASAQRRKKLELRREELGLPEKALPPQPKLKTVT